MPAQKLNPSSILNKQNSKNQVIYMVLRPSILSAITNPSVMELQSLSIPLVITFLLLLLFKVMKTEKRPKTPDPNSKLPPGPWELPFIGNLHQLQGLPHQALRNLARKHGPLMHLQLGEVSTVIISSAKMAKEVMKTHDLLFADRPEILATKIICYNNSDVSFAPYGDYWRQLRKICTLQLLSAKRVQSFRSIREEEVANLIGSISQMAGSLVNLSEMIFSMTNDITSIAAFGKKCKDRELFLSAIREVIKLAGGFGVADIFPSLKLLHVISGMKPKLERMHQKLDRIFDDIIKERRESQTTKRRSSEFQENLIDVLLSLQESGDLEFPLTTNNIKAVTLDMFIGGSETSSTTIEWAMSEMMRQPRVMKKAQAEVRRLLHGKREINEADIHELNYLKSIIKETLRLHPPLPLLLPRECKERCMIDDYEIPKKTKVIVNGWAVGRDPEYWGDPESFKPERFDGVSIDFKGNSFEYIPFGAGRRICPGILFGIANIELPLAKLLYHFDWALPSGIKPEELDMTETFGATVRKQNELYVIPTSYSPLLEK